ncbi:MAG: 30S ribosomal protein S17 [Parcubacteria group bacterium]|nr:30S ribosomal protein S17 [Parcubacteria group bacterium]
MEETTQKITRKRRLNGIVASTKMQHTVVVVVNRVKTHPQYHKRYTTSKHYICDWRGAVLAAGTLVTIEETRPLSKTKRWRVIAKEGSTL